MLLAVYSMELNISVHTKSCTTIFLAVLFIIAKIWKQPICSSVGEWYQYSCDTLHNGISFTGKKRWVKLWKDMEETEMHTIRLKKPGKSDIIMIT